MSGAKWTSQPSTVWAQQWTWGGGVLKNCMTYQPTWKCTDLCGRTTFLLERAFLHFHVTWWEGTDEGTPRFCPRELAAWEGPIFGFGIWLWLSNPMVPFGVGAAPILEPILVGIGMFTGVRDFDPWPFPYFRSYHVWNPVAKAPQILAKGR